MSASVDSNPCLQLLKSARLKISESYLAYYRFSAFKIRLFSLIGVFGFPFYFWVWSDVFPQQYENLPLRLIGCFLNAMLFLSKFFPNRLQRFVPVYAYLVLTYSLPFFFTTMLLLSDTSVVWQLSCVAAISYIILLFDPINIFVSSLIGITTAFFYVFLLDGLPHIPVEFWVCIPVFMFSLCSGLLLNYSDRLIVREKMRAVATVGSKIAHEMRTPLMGIKLNAESIRRYLDTLLDAHEWAKNHDWPGRRLPPIQQARLGNALDNVSSHADSANSVIDMLLMNVHHRYISPDSFSVHSVRQVISDALKRHHFRPKQRQKVIFEDTEDWQFFGSDVLLMHVILNLLINSLRAIDEVGRGEVRIKLRAGLHCNEIRVQDNAKGIPEDVIPYIFLPFYTRSGSNERTGLGLAFCKQVAESFGGTIVCESTLGEKTDFKLSLPHVEQSAARRQRAFSVLGSQRGLGNRLP